MKKYIFQYLDEGTILVILAESEILAWEELASTRGSTVGWLLMEVQE